MQMMSCHVPDKNIAVLSFNEKVIKLNCYNIFFKLFSG